MDIMPKVTAVRQDAPYPGMLTQIQIDAFYLVLILLPQTILLLV